MTTAEYISSITNGILTLVKDNPTASDESTLGINEYFVLIFCTDYKSYLRNYVQYRGKFNYNTARDTYDIDIDQLAFNEGYYISKYFKKRYYPDRGRVIIVTVNDYPACVDLDDPAPYVAGLTDYDSNHYTTVNIGNQQWIVENFKTTHYENGVAIPLITNDLLAIADTVGAYYNYNNDITYKNTYGLLYNWYALMNTNGFAMLKWNGVKQLGWRVPSMADWTILANFINIDWTLVAGHLKEIGFLHWTPPNTGALDTYGWKGIGCGNRFIDTFLNQGFSNVGIYADYYATDVVFDPMVTSVYLTYDDIEFKTLSPNKFMGLNVKLVRDI